VKEITLHGNNNEVETYLFSEIPLGKGKSGVVYKATNRKDPNKVYAVKVIKLQSDKIRNECLR
jgi:serine/threonine protein kinase